jgi:AcrR family transcriptional regulator
MMTSTDTPVAPDGDTGDELDGRRQRRSRNREAVVDALLEMVDAGDLDPTIGEVANAAGLSARSVFRYFDDVDDLVRSAVRRQQERLAPVMERRIDPTLELTDRIRAFVEHRIDLLESMGNVGRLARLRAPVHPLVAEELGRIRATLIDELRETFEAELGAEPAAHLLAASDVVCSFEAYEALKRDHGFERAHATEAMITALELIIGSRHAR